MKQKKNKTTQYTNDISSAGQNTGHFYEEIISQKTAETKQNIKTYYATHLC